MNYSEEDTLVDYKLTFDNSEREWLEITKDIVAFTNTYGGYLIFGVKDGAFEKIGIDDEVLHITTNTNNIIQKINRNIEPHIQLIRCKTYQTDDKNFAIIFIPPSLDKTHMISRDASFEHRSGKIKQVLYFGTTYVRRSAGNHMMGTRDLDDIVNRRISYFKDSLLDKIARVVEAPQETEVLIVTEDQTSGEPVKFVIDNAPDAMSVKGLSFTASPETTEQEIMGWIAMTSHDQDAIPAPAITWKWYKERHTLKLTNKQKIEVAKYSLLTGTPAFFGLGGCNAADIKKMLIDILSRHGNINIVSDVIATGAFLGNKFHTNLISKIGILSERIAPLKRRYPDAGPRVFFGAARINAKNNSNRAELESELQVIVESAENNVNHIPLLKSRWRADVLDCYLYAEDEQYVNN